jgi:hypothetical protein
MDRQSIRINENAIKTVQILKYHAIIKPTLATVNGLLGNRY